MKKIIEENGSVVYNGVCLKDVVKRYGTPLKITFLDIIKKRIIGLKNAFNYAIISEGYNGNFKYLNANKANYGAYEVETAFKYSDGLETSSYYDLVYSFDILKKYKANKLIVCNGFKLNDYLNKIEDINNEGYHIIDIIDSIDEYENLKKRNINLEVGLRIHLESLYSEEYEVVHNDRFGLTQEEFLYIIEDIKNTSLKLTTIHFHQRGFDYEEEKFLKNFSKVFSEYYIYAKKKIDTVINFNMGGGTPLPLEEEFDYYHWATFIIKTVHALASEHNISDPNILSENGKYSQKDATINIYKIIGTKETDEYPWKIVDGSLLIAMPEYYALNEPIKVIPINKLQNSKQKVRLAGVTCDCDDIYYNKSTGYFELPISDKDLYIGLIGTGSYQNSMNGKGGVHHCLLPEEIDLVIDEDGNEILRSNLQSIDEIYRIIKYKK